MYADMFDPDGPLYTDGREVRTHQCHAIYSDWKSIAIYMNGHMCSIVYLGDKRFILYSVVSPVFMAY